MEGPRAQGRVMICSREREKERGDGDGDGIEMDPNPLQLANVRIAASRVGKLR